SDNRLAAEMPLRIAEVIGAMPLKIRQAVSSTLPQDTIVPVSIMHLTANEYPGSIPRRLDEAPEAELTKHNLRFAGAEVYTILDDFGYNPRLKYVMNWDIRCYELHIVIDVRAV